MGKIVNEDIRKEPKLFNLTKLLNAEMNGKITSIKWHRKNSPEKCSITHQRANVTVKNPDCGGYINDTRTGTYD